MNYTNYKKSIKYTELKYIGLNRRNRKLSETSQSITNKQYP